MPKGQSVLTTGDIAKICNVAARTVSKWVDNGTLIGYRIPGSKDRRVPISTFETFLHEQKMDIDLTIMEKLKKFKEGEGETGFIEDKCNFVDEGWKFNFKGEIMTRAPWKIWR